MGEFVVKLKNMDKKYLVEGEKLTECGFSCQIVGEISDIQQSHFRIGNSIFRKEGVDYIIELQDNNFGNHMQNYLENHTHQNHKSRLDN